MWVLLAGTEGEPCLSPQSERGGQASSDPRAGSPASRRGARPTTMAAPGRRARRPAHTAAAQGRMAAGWRPAGSAGRVGAARGCYCCCFLRDAAHTWSPAHSTRLPLGRTGRWTRGSRGHPRPASPRELPREAELLVKGSRRGLRPSLPPAWLGQAAAASLAPPGAVWGHSWQRRGRLRGRARDGQVAPSCPSGRSRPGALPSRRLGRAARRTEAHDTQMLQLHRLVSREK